jgi:hypothetical protein
VILLTFKGDKFTTLSKVHQNNLRFFSRTFPPVKWTLQFSKFAAARNPGKSRPIKMATFPLQQAAIRDQQETIKHGGFKKQYFVL